MHIVLGPAPEPAPGSSSGPSGPSGQDRRPERPGHSGQWLPVLVDDGRIESLSPVTAAALPDLVRVLPGRLGVNPEAVRWVFASVTRDYRPLLEAGVEIGRCWDLSLCQRILTTAATNTSTGPAGTTVGTPTGTTPTGTPYSPTVPVPVLEPEPWATEPPAARVDQGTFFDLPPTNRRGHDTPTTPELANELVAQLDAVSGSRHRHRLKLLLAAESQGALIAAEILHEGLPWRRDLHERMLAEVLGPRPAEGQRPRLLQELAEDIAVTLGVPGLNPDSPQDLLRGLNLAGIRVASTRAWDLKGWAAEGGADSQRRAGLISGVLEYKRLYRLWTANGWHWLDEWVRDGRFHPAYSVGGVVTGRWAAHGGGAMQIPAAVRDAVRADPGHLLTVADASQVEPRILAAMSGDRALAEAGSGHDLYLAVAEQGRRAGSELGERSRAKVALLGAMYGATTGDSAALMPHLRRLFPEAIGLLERAARRGEEGGQVSTWLGRTSPPAAPEWLEVTGNVSTAEAEARARTVRRSAGRFTRNFVIQGTAAEWALCWMGEIRRRLRVGGADGVPMQTRLVFFVHDEVVLHGPAEEAPTVHQIVTEAAQAAGRLLFGVAPVEFPLSISAAESYAAAH
ncbi:bifunctional 3'-5' exonuclease/DNA polymerase [Citricoccus zhacaiensis]|uniref:DNA-directed DNA polymerase n=1 Tax=Citricoccus zhacaiensis TaxID=489142 RepID=A0ABQ2LZ91_9MICC|nr:bifunctional 3'-5' exonuclease/DNA polymerase [Citricoccus zhacaiensis]GGO44932.1 bifunctional 3'-5' exonuclease/DNA polymerase [Citricoccus zhacaiensis]